MNAAENIEVEAANLGAVGVAAEYTSDDSDYSDSDDSDNSEGLRAAYSNSYSDSYSSDDSGDDSY